MILYCTAKLIKIKKFLSFETKIPNLIYLALILCYTHLYALTSQVKRRLVEDTATRARLVGAPNSGRRKGKQVHEINNFTQDTQIPNLLRGREGERER